MYLVKKIKTVYGRERTWVRKTYLYIRNSFFQCYGALAPLDGQKKTTMRKWGITFQKGLPLLYHFQSLHSSTMLRTFTYPRLKSLLTSLCKYHAQCPKLGIFIEFDISSSDMLLAASVPCTMRLLSYTRTPELDL